MHRIYLYIGPKTASEKSQRALLRKHDLDPELAFIDYAPDREARRDMIHHGLHEGATVYLTTPAALGSGKTDVFKTALALGKMNVLLRIVGEDSACLYETTEAAADFAKRAVRASRHQNAIETAKAKDVGRPAKWEPTAADIAALRPGWHDLNVPAGVVLETAENLAKGKPADPDRGLTRQDLHRILGARSSDPDTPLDAVEDST